MGYQALLFCPDEKLARIVSKVFSELDFAIEPVHEPFAAVKRLMTRRFDAIVVDCENEQNASLLFKSARNSSFNQSSLAIAVVEGQAGVAKAYRIGANLVLTKPINVEQAKGTLRVARGLLRKNADSAAASGNAASTASPATPAPPPRPAPVASGSSFQPANRNAEVTPPATHLEPVKFETPAPPALPAMAASASLTEQAEHKLEDVSSVAPPSFAPPSMAPTPIATATAAAPPAQTQPPSPVFRNDIVRNDQVRNDIVRNDQIRSEPTNITATSLPVQHPSPSFQSVTGSAAAPAPAKEALAPAAIEHKAVAVEAALPSHDAASASVPEFTLGGVSDAPSFGSSFGALDEEDASASASKKKILMVAAAVLVVAALAYVGYGALGKSATAPTPPPVTVPQQGSSAVSPMSAPAQAPSNGTPAHTSSVAQILGLKSATSTPLDKTPASSASPPVIRIAADTPQGSAPETKKSEPAPIVVKSNAAGSRLQTQNEDSAPLLANSSATSADDSKMSGLMSSSSSSVAKPSLAALKVSQGVSQGLVIKRVQPKYPPAALSTHTQGEVLIEATINKEGNVIDPKVIHGDSMLAHAALDAVRQWRYKPYYLDGEPVEIQTQITINFKVN
jgi:TonB family protein